MINEEAIEGAIRQVREGHVDAYEVVVRAYQGRLRAMLANSCPPGLDPDELAHLAFVDAFKKIDRYSPGTRFFSWLATIARILVLIELRKLRREARGRENYLETAVARVLEDEIEAGGTLDESRVRALRDCVGALPEGLRALVDLRYSRDHSIDSISRRIGKSASAVKFQLFDIRRKLRACVDGKLVAERG